MPLWYVDSLDSVEQTVLHLVLHMDKGLEQYGWTMLIVADPRANSNTVPMVDGELTTVATMKMQAYRVAYSRSPWKTDQVPWEDICARACKSPNV